MVLKSKEYERTYFIGTVNKSTTVGTDALTGIVGTVVYTFLHYFSSRLGECLAASNIVPYFLWVLVRSSTRYSELLGTLEKL